MTTSYRSLFDLTGRVALVTGGAGVLGRRFAAALADHGAAVAIVDLDEKAAIRTAAEIAEAEEARCAGFGADVSKPDSVKDLVARVEAEFGRVRILMNNAATKSSDPEAFFKPVETFDLATWRAVMAVNLDGMFLMAQAFGQRMAENGGGSIIQTASIYGLLAPDPRIYEGAEYHGRPINTPAVYTASKGGVIALTRHLATTWGAAGVRVNTLTPGGVDSGQNDAFRRRYAARVPLGRMARADDMIGAAIFLASDASSYVTGQNIVVDGGLSAW